MKCYISFVFLLSNVLYVWSYSTGAPNSKPVCSRRLPHHGVKPQNEESPYVIMVNTTSPGYGDFIEVTITTTVNTPLNLKGFLIQALPNGDKLGSTYPRTIGTFAENNIKLLNCFHDNDTATHIDNNDKSSIKLVFKMSSVATYSKFSFRGTVVKDFRTFWTDISSVDITPPDAGISPSEVWTRRVIQTASRLSAGKQSWNQNIRERLKQGYSGMIDSLGQLNTRNIYSNLPFPSRHNSQNSVDNNSLYRSNKKLNLLSSKSLTREMLQGDLRSALFLEKKLNMSDNN